MAETGVTVVKRFFYRGDATEEFSNQYWFQGASTPTDTAGWRALFDALVLQEKTLYTSLVTIVRGYGYDSSAEHVPAVWSVDLTQAPNTVVPGTMATTGSIPAPGDAAVWIRWKTDKLTSKGKPIYLRKYYHDARIPTAGGDAVHSTQQTALNAFGLKLRDGTFLGGQTVRGPGSPKMPAGTSITLLGHGVSSYATTRTLKRRPKRVPG